MRSSTKRLVALDVFRGLTIAGMILVNTPGGPRTWPPLLHAEWHGWTPTDLVFPFFLFILGVAQTFSLARRRAEPDLIRHIVLRTLVIFAIGVAIGLRPERGFDQRLLGVLQRIALVYGATAVITLKTTWRGQAAWAAGLSSLYWALMAWVPVPGSSAGDLTRDGNLAGFIDRLLLGDLLYTPTWDPEGLLHTLPAISSALIGVLAGHWIRRRAMTARFTGLAAAGVALTAAGLAVDPLFPINKNLWSPSYVLFTGGLALVGLGLSILIIDRLGLKAWTGPFVWLGRNPLFAYVGSVVLGRALRLWPVAGSTPRELVVDTLLLPWLRAENASLVYAAAHVLLWVAVCWVLFRKRIVIKI